MPCAYEGCNREVYSDAGFPKTDKCIFHAKEKDPQKFRNALAIEIQRLKNENAVNWDFSGFVFVDEKNSNLFFCGYQFSTSVSFKKATFIGEIYFSNATFKSLVSFQNAIFRGVAVFNNVKYKGWSLYHGSEFFEVADFYSAEFNERATFESTSFNDAASFKDVAFSGSAIFRSAKFHKTAEFNKATFNGVANFCNVVLYSKSDFENAIFYNSAIFCNAMFCGGVNFYNTSFAVLGNLDKCVIAGDVRWTWPGAGKKRDEKGNVIERGLLRFRCLRFENNGILDFTNNSLADDCKLKFEQCDTSRVMFEGTDCTRIEFYANRWPRVMGRYVAGDEYIARERNKHWFIRRSVRWDLIQITYHELAKRFREDYVHDKANDFDRGVFEMRRLSPPQGNFLTRFLWGKQESEDERVTWWHWIFRPFLHFLKRRVSLAALYRYVSLYSGSVLLPFFWLAAVTAGFGLLYANFLYNGVFCRESLIQGMIAALRVATLNRGWLCEELKGYPHELNLTVSLIAVGQIILTALLITMLVFAVRRRFKH